MKSTLTSASLRWAIPRISARMEQCKDMLNSLDGQLGDGDLGITMMKGFQALQEVANDLPDDIGTALLQCAQALTKAGASSYATLLATGLMAAAKEARGQSSVAWKEVPRLLDAALEKMASRGKSATGEKTVLDAVAAARDGAAAAAGDPAEMVRAAYASVAASLDTLRDQPCKQGRARIFADKSKGMDDPGMVAFKEAVAALAP